MCDVVLTHMRTYLGDVTESWWWLIFDVVTPFMNVICTVLLEDIARILYKCKCDDDVDDDDDGVKDELHLKIRFLFAITAAYSTRPDESVVGLFWKCDREF